MLNYISACSVILAYMFVIYFSHEFIFSKRFEIKGDYNENILSEMMQYKSEMPRVLLLGTISLFLIAIFGHTYNCTFIAFNQRISGIQQFSAFWIVYLLIEYMAGKNEKYRTNVNKVNLNRKRRVWYVVITFLAITLTIFVIKFIDKV